MKISIANVSKSYDRRLTQALSNISLSVESGQIIGLMGPSGSGKSTLLNIVSTMDQPTSGDVKVNGRHLQQMKPWSLFRARHIGFIFQFHYLLPQLTLQENVEIPMVVIEKSRKVRSSKAKHLLQKVDLFHKRHAFANRISGGERQRTAIARSLANSPKLILADEPTGNVDTDTGMKIMTFVIEYCREHATTMIVATHNHEIAQLTDRTIYLKNGQIDSP